MLKKESDFILVQGLFSLLILQYQVNWLFLDTPFQRIYNLFVVGLMALYLVKHVNVKFVGLLLILITLVASVVLGELKKAPAAAIAFCYGYCVILQSQKSLNRVISYIIIISCVLFLIQIAGIHSIFYEFQFYSERDTRDFIHLLESDTGVLPSYQSRPPGIFPSTIYLSVFQCLAFGQLLSAAHFFSNRMHFFCGVMFALTGSTTSLLLFFISFVFITKKSKVLNFQKGFLSGLIFLFVAFPLVFFENYTFEEKTARFTDRFISEGAHSSFTANIISFFLVVALLSVIIIGIRFLLRKFGKFDTRSIILFFTVCITPMVVHPILEDIRYWVIIGTACAQLITNSLIKFQLSSNNATKPLFNLVDPDFKNKVFKSGKS